MRCLKVLLIIFQASLIFGNNQLLDSLNFELAVSKTDHQKVELLLKVSKVYRDFNPEESLCHAERAHSLAVRVEHKIFEAKSLIAIGTIHAIQWKLDQGLDFFKEALLILQDIGDDENLQICLNAIGSTYFRKGDNEIAMEYFHKALKAVSNEKDSEMAARILGNLGNVYYSEGDVDKALFYNKDVLRISRKRNNRKMLAATLINLGAQYSKKKEYEKAIAHYKEALEISEELNNIRFQVLILMNLANRYSKEEPKVALNYYKRALRFSEEIGEEGNRAKIFCNLAGLYERMEDYDIAINYAGQSLALSNKIGDKRLPLDIYKILIRSNRANENYEQAFLYKSLYHQIQDSLFSIEKTEKILEISTKYETEKKEMENQLLRKKQAENEFNIRLQRIIGLLAFLVFILMSVVLVAGYKSYRIKENYSIDLEEQVERRTSELVQSNIRLKESNEELERFAFIASHDLKEPLRNIVSFTSLLTRRLAKERKVSEEISDYASFIVNNTKKMNQLIEDVLEYSKVNQNVAENFVLIEDIIKSIAESISFTLREKNVVLIVGELPKIKVNHSQLFIVLKNLIENGVKYNDKEKPVVSIKGELKNGLCEISVEDNGIGIEKQYFEQVFEMFKRLHGRGEYGGSGLGLSTCKKIINKMQGEIFIDSKPGEGSKFTFTFVPDSLEEEQQQSLNIDEAFQKSVVRYFN